MHAMHATTDTAVGLTLMVGRGRVVDWVAAHAEAGTTVVDVGCGPGSAARAGARRGAHVLGVDPSPAMLRLARRFTPGALASSIQYERGAAEDLPVPDGWANVVWAVMSAHHWADIPTGLRECRRACGAGGTLLVVEHAVVPGARGHAAHGFTPEQAETVAAQAFDAGFRDVGTESFMIGRKSLVAVRARCEP
jgi:ubiquinone/menaquinone biosynthesis C-methylase UbiE